MRLDSSDHEGIEQLREALRTASYDAARRSKFFNLGIFKLDAEAGERNAGAPAR